MSERRENDLFLEVLDLQIGHERQGLIRDARHMADRLNNLVKQVERGPHEVTGTSGISEIGELQASATMFDARCARLTTLERVRKDYNGARASDEV